jgi:sugar lactone lactonase YvrE
MLVVSMKDHRLMRRQLDGSVAVHADLTELCAGHPNDLVVDARGRSYVGNFGFDLMAGDDPVMAPIFRVDPDGRATVAAKDLIFPNGSVITTDSRTLIVGETLGCRYTAFNIADDGSLTDRRLWAELAPTPTLGTIAETLSQVRISPDRCGLDAEGYIWTAVAVGARCIRVAPGGAIVDEVAMPAGLGVFACMLGGPDGRTMLICAAPDFFEEARKNPREAVLLVTGVNVSRAGLP